MQQSHPFFSSVCCPNSSYAGLSICFPCSLLITCRGAAASASRRSKNYRICTGNEHPRERSGSSCSLTLILPTTGPEVSDTVLLQQGCSANAANAGVCLCVCRSWCVMLTSQPMSVAPPSLKSIRILIVFMPEILEIFFFFPPVHDVCISPVARAMVSLHFGIPEIFLMGRSFRRKDK